MTESMKVAIMPGVGEIEFCRRPIPVPGPGRVLVKVEYVGICGSDLHYYESGRIGDFVVKPPFVLGHEAGGVVTALGEDVDTLKVGDRVALEPGIACGKCEFCRKGLYNLCPDVIFFATPPVDGVFLEYVAHPANLCFKLPDNVSTQEGALIEPLAVGFHAANTGGAAPGQTALVFGAGCIGLVSMMALRVFGVSAVYVSDVLPARMEKALALGASGIFNAGDEDIAQKALAAAPGGFDLIIETSGDQRAAALAISLAKKGATVVLVGYSPSGNMALPIGRALDKELTLKTIFRYRHVYPQAIRAVSQGKVNLKDIVTHTFMFDELPEAMRQSVANKAEVVKAVVQM
jgi:L-iditol 2-dehydrogenase